MTWDKKMYYFSVFSRLAEQFLCWFHLSHAVEATEELTELEGPRCPHSRLQLVLTVKVLQSSLRGFSSSCRLVSQTSVALSWYSSKGEGRSCKAARLLWG